MKNVVRLFALSLLSGLIAVPICLAGFDAEQKAEIGKISREYLLAHPEVLIEASKKIQAQQVQRGIKKNATALFASPTSPMTGNSKGKINLVEFFDYQCPHCKHMDKFLMALVEKNADLRVTFKELPIFGGESQMASLVALAAERQGKYLQVHKAFMRVTGKLTREKILSIATDAGIKTKNLDKLMKNAVSLKELKSNTTLAQQLGLRGTPAFILGHYPSTAKQKYGFIPGATDEATLQGLIDAARH